jgi:putative spermidine/putrescine transport system ATP-binding protein
MIRAESFFLTEADAGPSAVSIRGRLQSKAFRGENWLLQMRLDSGTEVQLSIPATRAQACGSMAPGIDFVAYAAANAVHSLNAAGT